MKIIGVELKAYDLSASSATGVLPLDRNAELAVFGTQIEVPDDRSMQFSVTLHTSNGDINLAPTTTIIPPAPSKDTLREMAARVWKSWN